jgi:ABC-type branched-subunit amino acid transport system ATPase component/branched-subunit amino acid ABC-type transport system permease component
VVVLNLSISGAVSGAIYSLLAIGLVLSYSTSRIFNFGHAGTAFACAYLYYQLSVALGWNKWLTVAVVLFVFAPAMGWIWDKVVFARLSGAEEATKIVAGVGVLIVVPTATVYICDLLKEHAGIGFREAAGVYGVPGIPPIGQHRLGKALLLTNNQLAALGVSIALFVLLTALLRLTPLGLRMRSAVDSPALAQLRGIDTKRVSTLSWMLSFFLAGVAGLLAAPLPGAFGLVNDNYTLALFVAITGAVVSGMRSIPLAFTAGLVIGASRNLVVAYVNGDYFGTIGAKIADVDGLTASLPYFILFAALIALGKDRKRRKAGTSAASAAPLPDYQDDLGWVRRAVPLAIQAAVVLVPGLFFADGVWQSLIITGFAMAIVFLSFTVVLGIGGMVSLAQGAFATAAGLTAAALIGHGWPFVPAALAGMVVAAALGAVTALPAMRLDGLMLTFSTLALALLSVSVLFKISWWGNHGFGWSLAKRPSIGPIELSDNRVMIVFVFVVMVLVAWMVANLQRSASGRAMLAVRTAEPAAAASGVSPQRTKLLLFVISAAIAGLGGIMLMLVYRSITGTANAPEDSFLWLAAVVLFGVKRPASAIAAGVVFAVFPRIVTNGVHIGTFGWDGTSNNLILQILYGVGAIVLASRPDGLLAQQQKRARARRDRRRAGRATGTAPGAPAATSPAVAARTRPPTADAIGADPADLPYVPPPAGLLELHNLHAGYGGVEVLHGVTFSMQQGSALALLGANGSGKSTLCSVVAGLVPVRSGRILFDGEDISRLTPMARVDRGIVLVPESRGVFPSITVEENLQIWLPNGKERARAYEAFEPLARRKNLPAGNLSGGEQQMLSLAPFLVRTPRLLVSDEPSLGLARIITAEIMDALQRMQAEGTSLLLVEEKARDVLTIADRVGALQRGELQWINDRADVDDDRVAAAYLGMGAVLG